MKRKKGTVLIFFILLIPLFNYVPLTSAQTIIIDSADNIQQVINSVEPYTTIFLNKGEYNQNFEITKPLQIVAKNPNYTIINVTSKMNKPAIIFSSSNILLSNVTVRNNGPGLYTSGVRILKDYNTIKGCKFTDTPIGISIWSNHNTITNCMFNNCSDEGIVLLSTMISSANNNYISHSTFNNNCDGIEMQQSRNNTIISCIFNNNYHSGIDGIDCENNNNIIQDCIITNNSVHGIYLSNSNNIIIKNCSFYNNTDGNIITPQSTNIITIDNVFKVSIQNSERVYESSRSTIESSEKTNSFQSIIEHFISFISNIFSLNKSK